MAEYKKRGYLESGNEIERRTVKLIPEEREIVLIMNDRDRKWEASCSSPTYMKKFEKQGWICTGTQYYPNGDVCTKFYEAPSQKSISIGKAERPKRQISETQLAAMAEGRKKKKPNNSPDV